MQAASECLTGDCASSAKANLPETDALLRSLLHVRGRPAPQPNMRYMAAAGAAVGGEASTGPIGAEGAGGTDLSRQLKRLQEDLAQAQEQAVTAMSRTAEYRAMAQAAEEAQQAQEVGLGASISR